jgi:hypothetical protein
VPWRPTDPGDFPTLGWLFLDWVTEMLARPDLPYYEPFVATQEQADYGLEYYRLNPRTGQRVVRRGVISRPRGWGKSPWTGAFAAFEALGPAVPNGWDADGQPVGMPWSEIRKPLVEIAAVSEQQVDTNTWSPLIDMLTLGPVMREYPGLEPMGTFVALPYGRIQKRTAEARSAKGAPACFVVCDQTEEWTPSNGGVALFNTLRNNVLKRGGHLMESPNAFTPGLGSVAENSMATYLDIKDARSKGRTSDRGVYFDHREAPPDTDPFDPDSLMRGLEVAYGDSADVEHCAIHDPPCERPGWVDLGHIASSVLAELDTNMQLARADWLNQITHAADAWIDQPTWSGRFAFRADAELAEPLADRDVVTLGFDGSRGRAKGKPDATALVGCRVSDGHLFEVAVWEAPDGEQGKEWTPPIQLVEAAIAAAFDRFRVAAFYADPAKDWRSYVNAWEAKYAVRLVTAPDGKHVKASVNHPFEWWMTGGRSGLIERAIEQLEGAIRNGDMTHDGSYRLTQHVLNARRRFRNKKLALAKEHDHSPNKIDAAVAAVLAWQARLDCVAAGVGQQQEQFVAPRRLR